MPKRDKYFWILDVSYKVEYWLSEGKFNRSIDNALSSIAGSEPDSGSGFGMRDLTFYFKTKTAADKAKSKINKVFKDIKYKIKLKVTVYSLYDDA